jgi:hypothetical protein
MNEAHSRILQTLQYGMITAEEAERLLDAVREQKPKNNTCDFCHLSADSLAFLAGFVRLRGNLRELARDREMSHWSARTRLDEIIAELGYDVSEGNEEQDRKITRIQVLDRLQAGEITADEATEQLRSLRG